MSDPAMKRREMRATGLLAGVAIAGVGLWLLAPWVSLTAIGAALAGLCGYALYRGDGGAST